MSVPAPEVQQHIKQDINDSLNEFDLAELPGCILPKGCHQKYLTQFRSYGNFEDAKKLIKGLASLARNKKMSLADLALIIYHLKDTADKELCYELCKALSAVEISQLISHLIKIEAVKNSSETFLRGNSILSKLMAVQAELTDKGPGLADTNLLKPEAIFTSIDDIFKIKVPSLKLVFTNWIEPTLENLLKVVENVSAKTEEKKTKFLLLKKDKGETEEAIVLSGDDLTKNSKFLLAALTSYLDSITNFKEIPTYIKNNLRSIKNSFPGIGNDKLIRLLGGYLFLRLCGNFIDIFVKNIGKKQNLSNRQQAFFSQLVKTYLYGPMQYLANKLNLSPTELQAAYIDSQKTKNNPMSTGIAKILSQYRNKVYHFMLSQISLDVDYTPTNLGFHEFLVGNSEYVSSAQCSADQQRCQLPEVIFFQAPPSILKERMSALFAMISDGLTIDDFLLSLNAIKMKLSVELPELKANFLNFRDADGDSLLHRIAKSNNPNKAVLISAVLAAGANPDVLDEKRKTPLMYLVETDNEKALEKYLKYEPNLNIIDNDNNTALHIAISKGNINSVELLVKQGADTEIKNEDGHTAEELANSLVETKGAIGMQIVRVLQGKSRNSTLSQAVSRFSGVFQNSLGRKGSVSKQPEPKDISQKLEIPDSSNNNATLEIQTDMILAIAKLSTPNEIKSHLNKVSQLLKKSFEANKLHEFSDLVRLPLMIATLNTKYGDDPAVKSDIVNFQKQLNLLIEQFFTDLSKIDISQLSEADLNQKLDAAEALCFLNPSKMLEQSGKVDQSCFTAMHSALLSACVKIDETFLKQKAIKAQHSYFGKLLEVSKSFQSQGANASPAFKL